MRNAPFHVTGSGIGNSNLSVDADNTLRVVADSSLVNLLSDVKCS